MIMETFPLLFMFFFFFSVLFVADSTPIVASCDQCHRTKQEPDVTATPIRNYPHDKGMNLVLQCIKRPIAQFGQIAVNGYSGAIV